MTCRRAKKVVKKTFEFLVFLFAQLVIKAQNCKGKTRNSFQIKFTELNNFSMVYETGVCSTPSLLHVNLELIFESFQHGLKVIFTHRIFKAEARFHVDSCK